MSKRRDRRTTSTSVSTSITILPHEVLNLITQDFLTILEKIVISLTSKNMHKLVRTNQKAVKLQVAYLQLTPPPLYDDDPNIVTIRMSKYSSIFKYYTLQKAEVKSISFLDANPIRRHLFMIDVAFPVQHRLLSKVNVNSGGYVDYYCDSNGVLRNERFHDSSTFYIYDDQKEGSLPDKDMIRHITKNVLEFVVVNK